MGKSVPFDDRDELWAIMELAVQKSAPKKDKSFRLSGLWKSFYRVQDGFKVFLVDGCWVYNNLSIIFGHGGHGYVHEFIPVDEIWVSTVHNADCESECGLPTHARVVAGTPLSQDEIEATIAHEIFECRAMSKGKDFWTAHNEAESVLARDKRQDTRSEV